MKTSTKNALRIFSVLLMLVIIHDTKVMAADEDTNSTAADYKPIGAALAVGLAGLGAAIGLGLAGSAAIGAILENEAVFGRALMIIVLIEAIAIYGFVIAIMLVL